MTDIIKSENNVPIRFADMGDGTFAEVIAANTFTYGAKFNTFGAGKSLTSTGTSVSTLIPFDSTSLLAAGSVRVAVTDPGYIRIENTEAAASATDILVNPEDSILINTEGKRFISFVSLVGEATANIQPVGSGSFEIFPATLDLNFASNTYKINGDSVPLSNIVTFSRNSSASFVDVDGLIKYVTANEIRIDRNPLTGVSRGILIEEQRTNLLINSEMFGEAIWSKNDCTVSLNVTASPDGSNTADKIVENSATAAHFVQQVITAVSGTAYTVSFFVKAAERSFCLVGFSGGGVGEVLVGVNLTTGAIVSTLNSPDATSVTQFRNGWFRISVTKTATASVAFGARAYASQDGQQANRSYLGDGTSGVFAWGGQLETGAFPTSYIPTTTAQATRLADNAKIDGANFAAFYKQSEGTFYAEGATFATGTFGPYVVATNPANTNRTQVNSNTSALIEVFNNGLVASIGAITPGLNNKVAAAIKNNDFAVSINGGGVVTDNFGSVGIDKNRLTIGRFDFGGAQSFNGHISRVMYIPKRLSNTELQALTI